MASFVLDIYLSEKADESQHIYLVIDEEACNEIETELHFLIEYHQLELIIVKDSKGVNDTLRKALKKIPFTRNTIVNLVTTIPECAPRMNEVFIGNEEGYNEDWSVVYLDHNLPRFYFKGANKIYKGNSFTGVFNVPSALLKKAMTQIESDTDLLEVIAKIESYERLHYKKVNWVDCGHEVNYQKAKRKLLNSRAFNYLHVREDGIVVKSSTNQEKLKNESEFSNQLPNEIAQYFPEIIKSGKIDESTYGYEMEYFSYPNVSELQLYWSLSVEKWGVIFSKLSEILTEFKKYPTKISEQAHHDFYFAKTINRLNSYRKQIKDPTADWLIKKQTINGMVCLPFSELKTFIERSVKALYIEEDHAIMHGDFCFNNILYDVASDTVKLIDARGSFGESYKGIYGDVKYDIAKFLHSSVYGYDYLVNDLFRLDDSGDEISIAFNWRKNHDILEGFSNEMINNLNMNEKNIKFIVGLLFVSMTPLHEDSEIRQKAMYLHGVKILNECYNEW